MFQPSKAVQFPIVYPKKAYSLIPYGKQNISEQDIAFVVDVLRSDYLTQGPQVPGFESDISLFTKAKHAVACNSATSALHLSCLALGVGPGDRVWTSPISFVASANCGLYCGAEVDFVDIDPVTLNICPEALKAKLERAVLEKRALPKVVVPVHFCGRSCDMAAIAQLSIIYGFKIVEDASHAIGGQYDGAPIGSCKFSDICVFSFHPVKIITAGEGGIATTNSSELAARMSRLRSHGIAREPKELKYESHGEWYYEQRELGYNYRMTDLQAALGRSQLGRINEFIERRHILASRYDDALSRLPLKLPAPDHKGLSALHLYPIRIDRVKTSTSRQVLFKTLRSAGIGVQVHYIPIHLQPFYRAMGFTDGQFPNAEDYYKEALSLPMFPSLTYDEQDYVIEQVTFALSN